MKTIIGIIVGIAIAVGGFIVFSLIWPQIAQAPNEGNSTTVTPVSNDDLTIDAPLPATKINSPVTITGKARGTYYFEASFPIDVRDANGNVIGQGHAEAQSDWMTTDYVPFKATVTFTPQPAGTTGVLRLKNDNPSGDPERDKYLDVPVTF